MIKCDTNQVCSESSACPTYTRFSTCHFLPGYHAHKFTLIHTYGSYSVYNLPTTLFLGGNFLGHGENIKKTHTDNYLSSGLN